jgi:hypothetical protein
VKSAPALKAEALRRRADALAARDLEIRRGMDRVLANMLKMETFLRIVDTLRKLKGEQQDVVKEIERERKRLLESLLGTP